MNTTIKKIVYIEDDEEMIELVRRILSRKGYRVIGAIGGQEGLEVTRRVTPDLVLLDLWMPDIDGWDVFQQIRADQTTKNIPIIVITARSREIDKVLGLQIAGVDDYISKPFSPQELLDSVEKVLI